MKSFDEWKQTKEVKDVEGENLFCHQCADETAAHLLEWCYENGGTIHERSTDCYVNVEDLKAYIEGNNEKED